MGVIEIRKKSELARTSTMQKIEEREKKADLRVQERLALRKRAKQSHVLQNCSPFAKLTEAAQEKIIDKMTYEKINSGEIVCQEGKQAERMYLLMSGKCRVEVDSKKVGDLKELDVFGEAALFGTIDDPSTRSTTVIAKSNLEVLVLLRDDLNELMKSGDLDPKCIKALQKVAQKRKKQNIKQLKLIAKQARVLQKCAPFADLTEEAHNHILDVMTYKKIKDGEMLLKKGDLANEMYLLMSGSCIVTDDGTEVGKLKKYDVFGEAALFHSNGVRSASVVAKEDLKVLLLKRKDLQELIQSGDLDKSCVEALEKISKNRKKTRASAMNKNTSTMNKTTATNKNSAGTTSLKKSRVS